MAQNPNGSERRNKCGHADCKCMVQPGEHFCSDYCAKASPANISGTQPGQRHTGERCKCGHPGCG